MRIKHKNISFSQTTKTFLQIQIEIEEIELKLKMLYLPNFPSTHTDNEWKLFIV